MRPRVQSKRRSSGTVAERHCRRSVSRIANTVPQSSLVSVSTCRSPHTGLRYAPSSRGRSRSWISQSWFGPPGWLRRVVRGFVVLSTVGAHPIAAPAVDRTTRPDHQLNRFLVDCLLPARLCCSETRGASLATERRSGLRQTPPRVAASNTRLVPTWPRGYPRLSLCPLLSVPSAERTSWLSRAGG